MSLNIWESWSTILWWLNSIFYIQTSFLPRPLCDPIVTTRLWSVGGWRHPRNPCVAAMISNGWQNLSYNHKLVPLSNLYPGNTISLQIYTVSSPHELVDPIDIKFSKHSYDSLANQVCEGQSHLATWRVFLPSAKLPLSLGSILSCNGKTERPTIPKKLARVRVQ